jgi:hypothetical protein
VTETARPEHRDVGRAWMVTTGLMLAGAVLLAWSAAIHLHLWMGGYRHIPTIGPLFLFQSIAGFAIAVVVAGTRRVVPALVGAAFLASSVGGLLLSAWVGLFGFHDGLDAPFAGMSLVVEGVGAVLLVTAGALKMTRTPRTRLTHTTSMSAPGALEETWLRGR